MSEKNNQAIFSARDVEMLRYALAYVKQAGVEKFEEEVAGIVQDPNGKPLPRVHFIFNATNMAKSWRGLNPVKTVMICPSCKMRWQF